MYLEFPFADNKYSYKQNVDKQVVCKHTQNKPCITDNGKLKSIFTSPKHHIHTQQEVIMLDKKSETLLSALKQVVPSGYKVLTKSEVIDMMPVKMQGNRQTLDEQLTFLYNNGYIDIKYRDKDEVCLCLTLKADSYFSTERNRVEKARITNSQLWILFGGMFLAAFLGAFVATLIAKLL